MLKRLKFAHKVILLPLLTALGFLLILAIARLVVARNGALLDGIETGYVQAFEDSQSLERALTGVQRKFQEAVVTRNPQLLPELKREKDAFQTALNAASANTTIESDQLQGIDAAFRKYHDLARQTTQELIQGESGGDQVVKAVDQIAHVAQQYLTATEQMSIATQSLARESERLKTMSGVFQV